MAATKGTKPTPAALVDPDRRTINNKVTGESIRWERLSSETQGEYTLASTTCMPGGGPPLHYHHAYTEHFRSIKGRLGVELNGKKVYLEQGEDKLVEIGDVHRFFNDGKEPVEFTCEVRPGHEGLEKGLSVMFGLANDGLSDDNGVPKSFIHGALLSCREWTDTAFAGPGTWLLNWIVEIVASYGKWRGTEEQLLRKYYWA